MTHLNIIASKLVFFLLLFCHHSISPIAAGASSSKGKWHEVEGLPEIPCKFIAKGFTDFSAYLHGKMEQFKELANKNPVEWEKVQQEYKGWHWENEVLVLNKLKEFASKVDEYLLNAAILHHSNQQQMEKLKSLGAALDVLKFSQQIKLHSQRMFFDIPNSVVPAYKNMHYAEHNNHDENTMENMLAKELFEMRYETNKFVDAIKMELLIGQPLEQFDALDEHIKEAETDFRDSVIKQMNHLAIEYGLFNIIGAYIGGLEQLLRNSLSLKRLEIKLPMLEQNGEKKLYFHYAHNLVASAKDHRKCTLLLRKKLLLSHQQSSSSDHHHHIHIDDDNGDEVEIELLPPLDLVALKAEAEPMLAISNIRNREQRQLGIALMHLANVWEEVNKYYVENVHKHYEIEEIVQKICYERKKEFVELIMFEQLLNASKQFYAHLRVILYESHGDVAELKKRLARMNSSGHKQQQTAKNMAILGETLVPAYLGALDPNLVIIVEKNVKNEWPETEVVANLDIGAWSDIHEIDDDKPGMHHLQNERTTMANNGRGIGKAKMRILAFATNALYAYQRLEKFFKISVSIAQQKNDEWKKEEHEMRQQFEKQASEAVVKLLSSPFLLELYAKHLEKAETKKEDDEEAKTPTMTTDEKKKKEKEEKKEDEASGSGTTD